MGVALATLARVYFFDLDANSAPTMQSLDYCSTNLYDNMVAIRTFDKGRLFHCQRRMDFCHPFCGNWVRRTHTPAR